MAKNISFDGLSNCVQVVDSAGVDKDGNAVTFYTTHIVSPEQLARHYDDFFIGVTGATKTKALKVIDDEKIRKGLK